MSSRLPMLHLHAVNLTVKDIKHSVGFYKDVFQLAAVAFTDDGNHALFMLDNAHVELHQAPAAAEQPQTATPHGVKLSTLVEDVMSIRKSLTAKGNSFREDSATGYVSLLFADPDGYEWQVVQGH